MSAGEVWRNNKTQDLYVEVEQRSAVADYPAGSAIYRCPEDHMPYLVTDPIKEGENVTFYHNQREHWSRFVRPNRMWANKFTAVES